MTEESYSAEVKAERRRYFRKPMKLRLKYKCLDKDQISEIQQNLAEDLGAGGLAMRSHRELKIDQVLMLTLYLPWIKNQPLETDLLEIAEEECTTIDILSRVAWCAPSKEPGNYMVGVQFLDLEQNDRQELKNFLVDYQLDQPDSSLYT